MSHEATTDLSVKYQKLATEYAKLRAQVVVLKKGVLDEQEKNNLLTEQAHEKDTQLRKYESEMEGVLFRNQQLSRRVNILQEEIDAHQTKSKSRWKSSNGSVERDRERADSSVINEELVAKITENARLHSTLDNIEKQYETTILTLQARIQDLEREKSALGSEQKHREREAVESVSELHQENQALRGRLTLLERDLALRTKQVESLEVEVEVVRDRLAQLESVSRADFSAVYNYLDPDQERRREEQERELTSLGYRLEESLSKLREVERDREHWRLELQLLHIKLEKQQQQQHQPTKLDADIEEIMTSREDEIKAAFEERLGELVKERLMADSKSTAFFLECEALAHKVLYLESEREKDMENLAAARASLEKVEEESRTLVANYEEQLSIMSDMLADMNGRLAAQGDTIHQLRQELEENEGRKKGKK